jgi:O-antigen biosynthesis protein
MENPTVDFCLKLRELGYRNVWTPHAELYHYDAASHCSDDTPKKAERFRKD